MKTRYALLAALMMGAAVPAYATQITTPGDVGNYATAAKPDQWHHHGDKKRWENATAEQKAQAEERHKKWQALTPEQKEAWKAKHPNWKQHRRTNVAPLASDDKVKQVPNRYGRFGTPQTINHSN